MSEILNPKITGGNSLIDVLLIGVSKSATEMALQPVIGNGTIMSGAIKLVGGSICHEFIGGKIGSVVGSGLVIDGAEDIIRATVMPTLSGVLGGNASAQEQW